MGMEMETLLMMAEQHVSRQSLAMALANGSPPPIPAKGSGKKDRVTGS
jgi:hypothetical protein